MFDRPQLEVTIDTEKNWVMKSLRSGMVRVSKFSSIFLLKWKIGFCKIVAKIKIFTLSKEMKNWKLHENSIFHFSIFLVSKRMQNKKLRYFLIFLLLMSKMSHVVILWKNESDCFSPLKGWVLTRLNAQLVWGRLRSNKSY
mgnify:CR=1 FL=1